MRQLLLVLTAWSGLAIAQPAAPPLPDSEASSSEEASVPEAALSTEEYPEDDLPPPVAVRKGWYGWQTLAVDGAGLLAGATLALTAGPRNPEVPLHSWLASGVYMTSVAASPLVHFAQRRPFHIGWASLAGRALLPPLGAIIGAPAVCLVLDSVFPGGDDGSCLQAGVSWSFLVSTVAVSVLDSLVLGNITVEPVPGAAEFYGWQHWIADGAALLLPAALGARAVFNGRSASSFDAVLGIFVYSFGVITSPILHAVNGRFMAAVGALGIRLLMPSLFILAGMGGFCAATAGADRCVESSIGPSLLLGSLTTAAIDSLWLGWKAPSKRAEHTQVFPIIEVSPERSRLGFAVLF